MLGIFALHNILFLTAKCLYDIQICFIRTFGLGNGNTLDRHKQYQKGRQNIEGHIIAVDVSHIRRRNIYGADSRPYHNAAVDG